MKAKDLLKENETAVIIFTNGKNFKLNDDGTGESGNWKMSRKAKTDKIIVYRRNREKNKNEIYLGDFVQLNPSTEKAYENRWAIEFIEMKFVGFAEANWNEFTDSKRGAVSPIRYIK